MSTFTARVFSGQRGHETNEEYERTPPVEEVSSYISSNSSPWPQLDPAALDGPAGDFVRLVEPHTEADLAAILVQFLVLAGNAIGRSPYYPVEADRHYLNEFALLIGRTGEGRKGLSLGYPKRLLRAIDPVWGGEERHASLSSGEGVIYAVRNPVEKNDTIIDQGVSDKRLCVVESEFASVLKVMTREGNILSPILRSAWDTGALRLLTKNSPHRATDAHISIVAHVTPEELTQELARVDLANGFLNRFLLVCVKRSKFLPDGGELPEGAFDRLARQLSLAFSEIRRGGQMRRDAAARALWHDVYPGLTTGRPGMIGALRARAAPHVLRLSCIYAALEGSLVVGVRNLRAALALWDYCEASAVHVFGDRIGDVLADHLLGQLRGRQAAGLTRTEIANLYQRNRTKEELDRALGLLLQYGLARTEKDASNPGRPVERWFPINHRRAPCPA